MWSRLPQPRAWSGKVVMIAKAFATVQAMTTSVVPIKLGDWLSPCLEALLSSCGSHCKRSASKSWGLCLRRLPV